MLTASAWLAWRACRWRERGVGEELQQVAQVDRTECFGRTLEAAHRLAGPALEHQDATLGQRGVADQAAQVQHPVERRRLFGRARQLGWRMRNSEIDAVPQGVEQACPFTEALVQPLGFDVQPARAMEQTQVVVGDAQVADHHTAAGLRPAGIDGRQGLLVSLQRLGQVVLVKRQ